MTAERDGREAREAREAREVFVAGGTGYIGRSLVATLLARGHRVRALAREKSAGHVPTGATVVVGNALDAESFAGALRPDDTFVHLVGTRNPGPLKARQFVSVDLASVHASVAAARRAGVFHFVYVSVAQPAPVMKAYVAARVKAENDVARAGFAATVLRPWYVVGPGHRWPLLFLPLYALARRLKPLRDGARRLDLVTLDQMVEALVRAVENPPPAGEIRVVEVPQIRGE